MRKNNIQIASIEPPGQPTLGSAVTFLEKFGRALHRYGLPSHRLEEALDAVAQQFGLDAQFFATPTAIFATVAQGDREHTVLIRVEPGEVNLEKLSLLDELLSDLITGQRTLDQASQAVDAIVLAHPRYRPMIVVIAFALASATAALFFGGGWREMLVCGAIGLSTGGLGLLAETAPKRFRVFEPAAAFIAGFTAVVASSIFAPLSVYVATCAGLIVLIPGLSLTVAIHELVTRNLAAGTVRLTYALFTFLQIGFGVAAGLKVGGLLVPSSLVADPLGLPVWALAPALVATAAGFTVLFQARLRDVGWILAACVAAFASSRLGSWWGGPEAGAFLGALVVGVGSHLHGRFFHRPISLTLVPGVILLVPGSVGFRGLSSLIAHDVVGGMGLAFKMGMLGIALVTGLLLAGTLVPPRRSL